MRRFRSLSLALFALFLICPSAAAKKISKPAWMAARVTITRDDWGIAHVKGKTDADAVFGMIYAQAEDDFNRIETNLLTALGRSAEAEGEDALMRDLRARLYVSPEKLKRLYRESPDWLKVLMDAWAGGLNWYLATHPAAHPKVLTRFEPWMALSFTEGSIGGDIERIRLDALAAFYGGRKAAALETRRHLAQAGIPREPSGSNGIALAPKRTADGHALLLINPHTSFFFRSELQMQSEEGLNAYGAVTWGQFFVYQGFNAHCGWMHTSSGVDAVDEFAEEIEMRDGKPYYRYGDEWRPLTHETIALKYKAENGKLKLKHFTVRYSHHGPIVREEAGRWIAFAMMDKPIEALQQSYLRTKAENLADFLTVSALQANSSNNTIFADDAGEIAYLHPQFVPKRDDRADYTHPVDGTNPRTDWQGLHDLSELPQAIAPANGHVVNTNNWPYSAAGPDSPPKALFPRYMDTFGENMRGLHASLLLSGRQGFTLDSLTAAAFDSYLPAFAQILPPLIAAYDGLDADDPLRAKLQGPILVLRGWDYRWSAHSTATTLAVLWGDRLWPEAEAAAKTTILTPIEAIARLLPPRRLLTAMAETADRLKADFGSWQTPWGEVNRFQRNDGAIKQTFDDAKFSIAVPFVSGRWGSLASFGAKRYPDTKRYYGTSGNSFVAVVEFGPKVKALAVSAGGESGDPASVHFFDQSRRYADGNLRPVYFYPDQLIGHTERSYHPGEPPAAP